MRFEPAAELDYQTNDPARIRHGSGRIHPQKARIEDSLRGGLHERVLRKA